MIDNLSLAEINSQAPYTVERDEMTGSYDFVTASGVQITIDNPKIVEIVNEFMELAKLLREKPSNES